MEIRNHRALVSGAAFLVIAIVYLSLAWSYDTGSAARMGPGYFPRMLGFLLALLGIVIMIGAVRPGATRERLERWDLKSLAWITGAIVLFAFLLNFAGLIIAAAAMLFISSLASHEFTWRGAVLTTVILTIFAVAAFYYGLGLQFRLLPAFS